MCNYMFKTDVQVLHGYMFGSKATSVLVDLTAWFLACFRSVFLRRIFNKKRPTSVLVDLLVGSTSCCFGDLVVLRPCEPFT